MVSSVHSRTDGDLKINSSLTKGLLEKPHSITCERQMESSKKHHFGHDFQREIICVTHFTGWSVGAAECKWLHITLHFLNSASKFWPWRRWNSLQAGGSSKWVYVACSRGSSFLLCALKYHFATYSRSQCISAAYLHLLIPVTYYAVLSYRTCC